MGATLARPKLKKQWSRENDHLVLEKLIIKYGSAGMQGYSRHMEDRMAIHENIVKEILKGQNPKSNKLQGYAYFAVFDGHGGRMAAYRCAKRLAEYIVQSFENDGKPNEEIEERLERRSKFSEEERKFKDLRPPTEESEDQDEGNETEPEPKESQYLVKDTQTDDLARCFQQGFLNFDAFLLKNMFRLLKKTPHTNAIEPSGATAITAFINGKILYLVNCGDSRAVLSNSSGEVVLSTKDHKPYYTKEKERVEKAGGIVVQKRVNGNLALSRALGDADFKNDYQYLLEDQVVSPLPDIYKYTLKGDEEFLVIACDGVWDYMTNEEMIKTIRYLKQCHKDITSQQVCEMVMNICCFKGSKDNISMILIEFDAAKNIKYDEEKAKMDKELGQKIVDKAEEMMKAKPDLEAFKVIMEDVREFDIPECPKFLTPGYKQLEIERKFYELHPKRKEEDQPDKEESDDSTPESESEEQQQQQQQQPIAMQKSS